MATPNVDIQAILRRDKKKKTFYACGKTYPLKEEFLSWAWRWNSNLKRWEYEGFEDEPEVKHFMELDYEKFGVWIKHDS